MLDTPTASLAIAVRFTIDEVVGLEGVCVTLIVGAVIFLFMLLLGAIQWISSGGDKANVEAARSRLTTALIGLVLLFAVFAVIKVIDTFFGTDILLLDIPSLVIQ